MRLACAICGVTPGDMLGTLEDGRPPMLFCDGADEYCCCGLYGRATLLRGTFGCRNPEPGLFPIYALCMGYGICEGGMGCRRDVDESGDCELRESAR